MQFLSRQTIKNIEDTLQKSYSLPIFKGYKAINKTGVEKLIDELYANLPEDIHKARVYLSSRNYAIKPSNAGSQLYNLLGKFEAALNKGVPFAQLVIVNIREAEELLNQIKDNVPLEIIKAENIRD